MEKKQQQEMPFVLLEKYQLRLKGYALTPRQKFQLLGSNLTDAEFILYDLICLVIVDWDKKHKLYGTFYYHEAQIINYLLGWSVQKVRRIFGILRKKGFVKQLDKASKLYEVVGYGLHEVARKKDSQFTYIEYLLEAVQNNLDGSNSAIKSDFSKNDIVTEIPNTEEKDTNLRNVSDENILLKTKSISKYSDNIVSSKREYRGIEEQGLSEYLTDEDMKWIDENVRENPKVPS